MQNEAVAGCLYDFFFLGGVSIIFAGPTGSHIISTVLATSEAKRSGSGGDLGVVWTG